MDAVGLTPLGVQVTPSGRYRTFTTTASVNGEPYRVLVATPMDATEATLSRVRLLLLWSTPVVLLLGVAGWILDQPARAGSRG